MQTRTSRHFLAKLAARRRFRSFRLLPLTTVLATVVLAGNSAQAAGTVIYKENNTTAITSSGSFSTTSGGATAAPVPGTGTGSYTGSTGSTTANPNAEILEWDSTVTGANSVSTVTAAVDGIIIANPGGAVTITPYTSTGQTLTVGLSGIDMSNATQDLSFGSSTTNAGTIRIGPGVNTGISETWNVASGRTLTVNSFLNGSQAGTSTLTLSGAGNVIFNGDLGVTAGAVSKMTISGATVTINSVNNASNGATTITSGTLNVGSGGTIGTLGTGSVANSGTLNFNRSNALTFGNTVTGAGLLQQLGGGTLSLTGSVAAGNLQTRAGTTVIDTGGAVTTSAFSSIGVNAGETGIVTLQNTGTWTANGDFNVGDTGSTTSAATGTLNISSSSTAVNSLTIGTGGGFYVGSGFAAGSLATGTVNQSNGSVTANNTTAGTFVIGGRTSTSGTGTYNLSGGFLTTKGLAYVGGTGTGTMNISGTGSYFANAGLLLANGTSAVGTVNLNGGTLTTTSITKGSGTGTFNFNGGTLATGSTTATALMTGLTTANVRNGGAIIDTGTANATIGQSLIHSTVSGDNATDGGLTKLGTGTLTLSASNTYTGDTTITAGQITMGANDSVGTGTVRLNGGTLRFNASGTLANNVALTAATGFISQNGGDTLTGAISSSGTGLTGTLNLAFSGANTISLGNGSTTGGLTDFHGTLALVPQSGVTTIGNLRFTNANIIGTGTDTTFDLGNAGGYINNNLGNSPALTFRLGALVGGTNSSLQGSTQNVNRTDIYEIGAKNLNTEFAGSIVNGTGGTTPVKIALSKVGTGTLTLSGTTSTYSGGTTISVGTLLVNNASGSATGTGAVSVTGGRLGGTGSISGAVTVSNGATLQGGAGSATGALTLTTNPTLNSGSIIELALGASDTHSSLVLAAGSFNGFNSNQAFTLDNIQAGTYDNIITGVAPSIATGGWTVTNGGGYTYSFTDDGSNIDLSVTAVPEPATVLGGLLVVGAFGWNQRRRLLNLLSAARA